MSSQFRCSACGGPQPVGRLAGCSPKPGVVVCRCCGVWVATGTVAAASGFCQPCFRARGRYHGRVHLSQADDDAAWELFKEHMGWLLLNSRHQRQLTQRWERALTLIRGRCVEVVNGQASRGHFTVSLYRVASQSNPKQSYLVSPDFGGCQCPDAQNGSPRGVCKHQIAAFIQEVVNNRKESNG